MIEGDLLNIEFEVGAVLLTADIGAGSEFGREADSMKLACACDVETLGMRTAGFLPTIDDFSVVFA